MSRLRTVLAFLVGTAVGGGSVWYVLKARYEEIFEQDVCSAKRAFRAREEKLQREIDSLKERLESPDIDTEEPKTIQASAIKNREKDDIGDYAKMISRVQYSKTSVPQPPKHEVEALYVISPDEFGEIGGCTQISLTYFDDGILSGEDGVIIDKLEGIVGGALNHSREYKKDPVFVRSDPKRYDYEILRDPRSYAEFRSTLPSKI